MNLPMMKSLGLCGVVLALGACGSSSQSSGQPAAPSQSAVNDTDQRLDEATNLIPQFRQNMPDSVAQQAQCVVAVPGLKKGGLIVGGESGKGFATCRTGQGWSAPAPVTVGGGSLGAQVGYQQADWLMLVMNDQAKNGLIGGNFKVGVDASAAAGPAGTGRGAGTEAADLKSGTLSYSKASGLFAGAVLNGAEIKPDYDSTMALYGKRTEFAGILQGLSGMPAQASAQRFVAAVAQAFG
jgi:lipid-binding SYLF domain-containing protein